MARVLVLQYDDRPLAPVLQRLVDRNRAYASRHGYAHRLVTDDVNVPGYWAKVFLIRTALLSNAFEYVAWLDTDAVIHDTERPLTDFFDDTTVSFVGAGDPPPWPSPFMAGVFFVKNDEAGRALMDAWARCYDPSRWTRDDATKAWKCQQCWWAGADYEQGAFVRVILPKYRAHIRLLPYTTLHEINPLTSSPFSFHFAGMYRRLAAWYPFSRAWWWTGFVACVMLTWWAWRLWRTRRR